MPFSSFRSVGAVVRADGEFEVESFLGCGGVNCRGSPLRDQFRWICQLVSENLALS